MKREDTTSAKPDQVRSARQTWMAVLARATAHELEAAVASLQPQPEFKIVKGPDIGTVMVEGRAGGAGERFNLGETTVTRAVVRLPSGRMGFAYALGRDRRKAELAALIDALLQDETSHGPLYTQIIAPLAQAQVLRREIRSRKAASTKVDFFTLVRGQD